MAAVPGHRALARPSELVAALDRSAARDAWAVFWRSRLLVLLVGVLAIAMFPFDAPTAGWEYKPWSRPFGEWPLGGVLDHVLNPLVRYDALWYLGIAQEGYNPDIIPQNPGIKDAFFPLYPGLVRVLSVTGSPAAVLLASYAVSLASLLGALYLLHRLATLELGARFARPAVALVAFAPAAYFFSAPYTESLFLLLTVGAVYAARTGHWAWAGALLAACSATRNTGVFLVPALVVLYLYGPRTDRAAAAARAGWRRLLPRHRLRPDVLWLALGPLGLVAFGAYLDAVSGDPLAWRDAQEAFFRPEATLPWQTAWDGVVAGWHGIGDLGNRVRFAPQNVYNLAALLFAVVGTVGVLRNLPWFYGVYLVPAVVAPLTAPALSEPLRALPRFVLVLFPLFMWLALVVERRGLTERTVAGFAVGLALITAAFSTWQGFV